MTGPTPNVTTSFTDATGAVWDLAMCPAALARARAAGFDATAFKDSTRAAALLDQLATDADFVISIIAAAIGQQQQAHGVTNAEFRRRALPVALTEARAALIDALAQALPRRLRATFRRVNNIASKLAATRDVRDKLKKGR